MIEKLIKEANVRKAVCGRSILSGLRKIGMGRKANFAAVWQVFIFPFWERYSNSNLKLRARRIQLDQIEKLVNLMLGFVLPAVRILMER